MEWVEDRVTPLLEPLLDYQLSLDAPAPPPGSYDEAAAVRGRVVFEDVGCVDCHAGATLTDADERLHRPEDTCMDPLLAERSATSMYRATPLRSLWQHPPYFHDGSAETLSDVAAHYEACLGLGLAVAEEADLIEYLRSL